MKKRTLLILSTFALLAACGSIPKRAGDTELIQRYMNYAGAPVGSFSALGRMDSWRPLARDKLLIWTGVNTVYLLTVDSFCMDLEFAEAIGVTTTGSSVHSGFDSVRIWNGWRRERCRILEIRPIDYRRMRQDAKEQ